MRRFGTRFANIIAAARQNLRERPANNLPSLDLLRTLAITFVITGHIGDSFSQIGIVRRLPLVYFGWTGVDLFFVLSGFLIGGQLWKEIARTGTVDVGRFILRRGFRIWPLYYALIAGLIVRDIFSHTSRFSVYVADLLCVSNYFHHRVGGGWSLSTEEQFYILFPLALYVASKFLGLRQLVILPIAWFVALPCVRWAIVFLHPAASESAIHDITYTPLQTHSDGLAAGLALAWLAVVFPGSRRLSPAVYWTLGSICVMAVLLRQADSLVFAYSSLALIFGALAYLAMHSPRITAVSNWKGFYMLSRLSYGMYLNHFGLLPHVMGPLQAVFGTGVYGFAAAWCLCMAASTSLAFVTFALIELPFLEVRERLVLRKVPTQVLRSEPASSALELREAGTRKQITR